MTLITGGSKGIGAGIARVFVAAGSSVLICARESVTGQAYAAELREMGPGRCQFEKCDVTQESSIQQVVEATVRHYGRLDCLINNAGWHPPHRAIDDFSVLEFEELLKLNLVSYFAACKYALPHIRKSRGSIINIGSLVAIIGQEWATTYVATKGGIAALTKALAIDEARHGVRVNTVSPGVISTPLTLEFVSAAGHPRDTQDWIDSWQWASRIGTSEEVGSACWFLASDAAQFLTGIDLPVSGGAELGYGVKLPKTGHRQL